MALRGQLKLFSLGTSLHDSLAADEASIAGCLTLRSSIVIERGRGVAIRIEVNTSQTNVVSQISSNRSCTGGTNGPLLVGG